MIGIVIVSHGNLALEFVKALEHILGPQDHLTPICIEANDDMEKRREELESATSQVNTGNGVVILSDMFGGTPSNLAISFLDKPNIEVIAGVNLPLLVKLATIRNDLNLKEAVNEGLKAGQKYICSASNLLEMPKTGKAANG